MDHLNKYREIIEQLLSKVALIKYAYGDIKDHTIFDRKADSYAVITQGWNGALRIHDMVIHIEIIDSKVWIQEDNTDLVIAHELEEAGIPKTDIVLGFQHPSVRQYTDYAAA